MKTKKLFLRLPAAILALALLVSLPFAILALCSLSIPEQYDSTYYAALKYKTDRLRNTPGERLIVVAGSSSAFGIDSGLIEDELGMPCVNFGLYGALGLQCMLDMSLPELHEGDIVVIAPELTSQMYSDFVGYSYLMQALESCPEMYLSLIPDHLAGFLSRLPEHLAEKYRFSVEGSPRPQGVYSLSAFNSLGDISYERPENIMDSFVASDRLPEIGPGLVTDSFADMINEYTAAAHLKGARVFFGFCPINSLALADSDADLAGFLDRLSEALDCPIISSLNDHIMDPGYFYDSNFHANDTGAVYNSLLLVNDVKRVLGNMTPCSAELPPPPAGSVSHDIISSGVTGGFSYEINTNGAVITGLDPAGLSVSTVNVPETIEGFPVYKIGSNAFSGCAAEEIRIPGCVSVLSASLFSGATELKSVYLHSTSLPEVGSDLMEGAPEGVTIYVPESAYGDYSTDYFWGRYTRYLDKLAP